jgi:hypothetical protein
MSGSQPSIVLSPMTFSRNGDKEDWLVLKRAPDTGTEVARLVPVTPIRVYRVLDQLGLSIRLGN